MKPQEFASVCEKVCLNLYALALPKEKQFQNAEYFAKADTLAEELKGQWLV